MEQHNRNEKTPWCNTGKPLVLCGTPVYFRISKAAAQTARLLKFAGKLPNMTAMVREIIRGDYLRLSEEWKREQAKKRAEEAKAKGGAK